MAASIHKHNRLAFQLPLKVSSDTCSKLMPEYLKIVHEAFAEDIPLLNKQFHYTEKIPYITIRKVCYTEGQIIFTFEVETEEELDQFFQACKEKTLSNILCAYADSCGIGIRANLKTNDSLILFMDMERAEYFKLKYLLCKNGSGEDLENSVANTTNKTQHVKQYRQSHLLQRSVSPDCMQQRQPHSRSSSLGPLPGKRTRSNSQSESQPISDDQVPPGQETQPLLQSPGSQQSAGAVQSHQQQTISHLHGSHSASTRTPPPTLISTSVYVDNISSGPRMST